MPRRGSPVRLNINIWLSWREPGPPPARWHLPPRPAAPSRVLAGNANPDCKLFQHLSALCLMCGIKMSIQAGRTKYSWMGLFNWATVSMETFPFCPAVAVFHSLHPVGAEQNLACTLPARRYCCCCTSAALLGFNAVIKGNVYFDLIDG